MPVLITCKVSAAIRSSAPMHFDTNFTQDSTLDNSKKLANSEVVLAHLIAIVADFRNTIHCEIMKPAGNDSGCKSSYISVLK
jgi:hypothetical protein